MHSFRAESEQVVICDIITPPYTGDGGTRPCTYYREMAWEGEEATGLVRHDGGERVPAPVMEDDTAALRHGCLKDASVTCPIPGTTYSTFLVQDPDPNFLCIDRTFLGEDLFEEDVESGEGLTVEEVDAMVKREVAAAAKRGGKGIWSFFGR
ncbi:hypothetical protein HK104_002551 [Borealophlyctis nickersoniae]|nr:hypothetical protein HK104_002551 [Borealophlyctis nickersoniae]